MKSRLVVVAVALALLAGACGSRSDTADEEPSGSSTTTTTTAASGTDSGKFGTVESPCGPGDASGATDTGVTDDSITVTGASDSGSAVAGLNKGIDDASAAFVKWCNDQGGINGREVKLNFQNANLFDYGPVVSQACNDSLALVGALVVFDDAGAQLQVDCGLVNVPASAVSSKQAGADLTYMPLPAPPNQLMVGAATYFKEKEPEAIKSAGVIHGDVPSIDYITARSKEAYTSIGFNFIYDGTSAIGETNWSTFALDMKSAGVKYFTAESTWEEIIGLQQAMAQQDFKPQITQFETNFYQLQYPAAADGVAEGAYVQLTTWPFEEADENPAMSQYLAALEDAVPGALPEQLGVQSFSAFLLWATAVKSLGSDVTREGLATALSDIHSWDGGGLHGTSDPGANKGAPCFMVLQIQGDAYVRTYPTKDADAAVYEDGKGFACDPKYIVDLTTDYDNGAKAAG